MKFVFDNDRPIYIQLVEQLKIYIISNKLEPGSKIPSVRDLAITSKVNPNTVQKALQELENEALIYTERTNGKFVTNDVDLIQELKNKLVKDKIDVLINEMKQIGITKAELLEYLRGE